MSEEKEIREATQTETATSKRRHNLKKHEPFEQEMAGIGYTDDVTVVREDGKEFVIKGRSVRSHLERGFTIKKKSAGKAVKQMLSDAFVGKKSTPKKVAKKSSAKK